MLGKSGDDDHELVLIAGYRDLESAETDFNEIERRTKHGLEMRAAALVRKNADGHPEVVEAANRHGRTAVGVGAGVGALFGLFAPPLGLSMVVGAAAGGLLAAFSEHELRSHLQSEVGEALQTGTAVILSVVYPHGRVPMELTMENASGFRELRLSRSTVNQIEGTVTELMEQIKSGTTDTSS
ncbi:MAG: DUF1269 domain-containing protein [Mycobacterium sp.]|nr:DUF1269 domain-containing protein [Mycobacterium sp.]